MLKCVPNIVGLAHRNIVVDRSYARLADMISNATDVETVGASRSYNSMERSSQPMRSSNVFGARLRRRELFGL